MLSLSRGGERHTVYDRAQQLCSLALTITRKRIPQRVDGGQIRRQRSRMEGDHWGGLFDAGKFILESNYLGLDMAQFLLGPFTRNNSCRQQVE